MASKLTRKVPEPTLRRLPLCHRFLKQVQASGQECISCTDIGRELGLDPTQIRKDFEAAGIAGRPRVGYVLSDLVAAIEHFLGWRFEREACLAGVESMGSALLGYKKFEDCGLSIVAAFDTDPVKIGGVIHGKPVLALNRLVGLVRERGIRIGIITVPAGVAQTVAELMVVGGIKAIWNFAPVRLRIPQNVIIHNEDIYCSLAALSQKLAQALEVHSDARLAPVCP